MQAFAGFCVFNDLAYASRALIELNLVQKVLIFDCDVHQGDGTARISQKDRNIFTCSIHSCGKLSSKKAKSDLDISIPRGAMMSTLDYVRAMFVQKSTALTLFLTW